MSRRVNAPAEQVFAMMSDFEHAGERVSGIERVEMLTDGPVGVGTRFRETRVMMGKEATEEMEVVDLQPGRSYTLACDSCGSHFETVVSCRPEGGATTVEMDMSWRPVSAVARLMSPLGFMMKGMMRKCIEKDLEDIARAAEGGGGDEAASA